MPEIKRVELSKQDIDDGNYETVLDLIDQAVEDVEPGDSTTLTIELTLTNAEELEPEEDNTEEESE